MRPAEIAGVYQEIIQRQFPGVFVRASAERATDDDPCLEAFCVPAERGREFMRYLVSTVPTLAEERGLQFYGVTPHSEEATLRYFPAVYADILKQRAPSGPSLIGGAWACADQKGQISSVRSACFTLSGPPVIHATSCGSVCTGPQSFETDRKAGTDTRWRLAS